MASGVVVSGLFIYPIKSCKGVSVRRAALAPQGLLHDRMMMLVDSKGRFLSQRNVARMALIAVDVEPEMLMRPEKIEMVVRAPGMEALPICWERTSLSGLEQHGKAQIWNDEVETEDLGDAAAAWFEAFLAMEGCRLVRLREEWKRTLEEGYVQGPETHVVSLADGYPLLLTAEESMRDLNAKVPPDTPGLPLKMDRFRPNVVVSGLQRAWQEDEWQHIRIGSDAEFQVPKPCARCKLPNTDQATAVVGKEPLQTLLRNRKVGTDVLFGQNLVNNTKCGVIEVGTPVEIMKSAKAIERTA